MTGEPLKTPVSQIQEEEEKKKKTDWEANHQHAEHTACQKHH